MTAQNETRGRGWCGDPKRGAALGRSGDNPANWGKCEAELVGVWIDAGGYDPGGTYWGKAEPLFELVGPEASYFFRAADRKAARTAIKAEFPEVTIAKLPKLDETLPVVWEVEVTPFVEDGSGVTLTDEQAQAVRLHLKAIGLSDSPGEIAQMGVKACEAALYDLLLIWQSEDEHADDDAKQIWTSDDGKPYVYLGE
jgi:hypothetical protein